MGLGTGPMRWDAGEVFTQSKRPVFIDRVMATTLMHPTGTEVESSEDSTEWIIRQGSKRDEMVSIRIDRKDGLIHVQPRFDIKFLLEARIKRETDRIRQGRQELVQKQENARRELAFKNLTNEQVRHLDDLLGELDRQILQLDNQKERLELIRDLRTLKVNMVLSTRIAGVKIDVKKIGNFPDQADTLMDK